MTNFLMYAAAAMFSAYVLSNLAFAACLAVGIRGGKARHTLAALCSVLLTGVAALVLLLVAAVVNLAG